MKMGLSYVALVLRIALVWWVLLVAVTAVFSVSVAFLAALLLFPWVALGIGSAAAWVQYRSLAATSGGAKIVTSPLTSGERQSLSLALPAAQAIRISAAAVTSVFGRIEQRVTDNGITANVIERGVKPTGLRALRGDQVTIIATDDSSHLTTRSNLQISCEPMHAWLYGLFWVEAGRGTRQVAALRTAIMMRVGALSNVADAIAQQSGLRARMAQVELHLLRAQIEPHFLFNTLAHLRASIVDSPQIAQTMLDALIEFLRANSQTAANTSISLADELHKVEAYLKIMQIRLGERLLYTIDSDQSLGSLQVPNASILILVENAVKHGIERIDATGMISVKCNQRDCRLTIVVDNDGPALTTMSDNGAGGLSNLRERLRLSYGDAAQMQIEGRDEGGVCASLNIPTQHLILDENK